MTQLRLAIVIIPRTIVRRFCFAFFLNIWLVYARCSSGLLHWQRRSRRLLWFKWSHPERHGWNESIHSTTEALQWRHYGRDGVSNHQPHDCLLNHLFMRRSKKTSKLRVTGLHMGKSPVTGEFPAQTASNAENVSIWWRHHTLTACIILGEGNLGWYFYGFFTSWVLFLSSRLSKRQQPFTTSPLMSCR